MRKLVVAGIALIVYACGSVPVPDPTQHAPAELATALPSDVNGKPLTPIVYGSYDEVVPGLVGPSPTSFSEFLQDAGREPSDLQVAAAEWVDRSTGSFVFVAAYRVRGVAANEFLDAVLRMRQVSSTGRSNKVIAGKAVIQIEEPLGSSTWYPKGEVVYLLGATDPADLFAALRALP